MEFKYNGKIYDTAMASGEHSTNHIQLTEDNDLKLAVINAWYDDEDTVAELLAHNELDIIFDYVLIMAKNQDIISGVTGERLSKCGTYPEWVIDTANEYAEDMTKSVVTDIIERAENEHDALEEIKKLYYDPEEWG